MFRSHRALGLKPALAVALVAALAACQTITSQGVPTSEVRALVYAESYLDGRTEISTALLRGLRALELEAGDRLWLGFAEAPAEIATWMREDVFGHVAYHGAMQAADGDVLRIELARTVEEDAPQTLISVSGEPVAFSASGVEEGDIVISWTPEVSEDQLVVRVHLRACDGATNPDEVALARYALGVPQRIDLAQGSHALGELLAPPEAIRCYADLLVGRQVAGAIVADPALAGLSDRSGFVVMNEPMAFSYEVPEE